jgi:hypothetical protein
MKVAMLGIAVLSLVAGCGQQPATPTTVRTDAGPITRRLPKLGSLQSVWWQSVDITINSFLSPPPHPAYRVRGLAQLEKAKAEEFSRNYEWQKMPASWTPDITVKNAGVSSTDWNRSSSFTNDCLPPLLPGELFFERSSGVVYFDIEVE